VRRPTLIVIILLFALIIVAAFYQIRIASREGPDLPGPTSPGELPRPASAT
jgi:hypothetical protein